MAAGTVLELWRWPVKSMAGERLDALRLGPHGVAGDRVHVVAGEHKGALRPLTAREAPRLLAWSAAYDGDPAGLAIVTGPDGLGRRRWDDPELPAALADDLGRPVELWRDPAGFPDLEDSILVTTEASRVALEAELGEPVDVRRFRPNLHLELDAEPWEELAWEGAELAVGDAVRLRLLHPCVRCAIPTRDPDTQRKWPQLLRHLDARHHRLFGINARVVGGGPVALQDQVRTVGSGASGSGVSGR
jgi:uncharacterized protein YcbX